MQIIAWFLVIAFKAFHVSANDCACKSLRSSREVFCKDCCTTKKDCLKMFPATMDPYCTFSNSTNCCMCETSPSHMDILNTSTELDFSLHSIPQKEYPHAKCLDGTPPAFYWRAGRDSGARSLIFFLQGGGWCYPSDIQQPCYPSTSHCTANCHIRANTTTGSSLHYPAVVPARALEGGNGYLSGNATLAGRFANFAVAYANYCDGGSFSGTMTTPDIALNGTPPLYYAGKWNLDAMLDELLKVYGVGEYERVVLSGCSAGGMACAIHCDYVRDYFHNVNASTDVKCICDAGVFMDIPTVTGAGDVMKMRFYDVADKMQTKASLNDACVEQEQNWQQCMFSETALKYTRTPHFVINSQYNFGEWEMLAPTTNQSFPPDTTASPPDWQSCYPTIGSLTPDRWANGCNATQKAIILRRVKLFREALAGVVDPSSPHGAWLNNCPSTHCQTGFDPRILISGTSVKDAVERWYFDGSTEKHVDGFFPSNPTCPSVRNMKSLSKPV